MSRTYSLPDFRYVGLAAGSDGWFAPLAVGAGFGGSLALVSTLVVSPGGRAFEGMPAPVGSATLVMAGFALGFGLAQLVRRRHSVGGRRTVDAHAPSSLVAADVPMAIVPWGVVLRPETEPRVLRWSAIERVTVETRHSMRGGVPRVIASRVTVATPREAFRGHAPGAVELECLSANLEHYAHESSRPLSADLVGVAPLDAGSDEPVVARLFEIARASLDSAFGASRLGVAGETYRSNSCLERPRTAVARLAEVLHEQCDADLDPRPLAALLAGMLNAAELVPILLRLASSPHPIVAAVAKASAVRLGAPLAQAGAVDELGGFLFDDDRLLLERWASGDDLDALRERERLAC